MAAELTENQKLLAQHIGQSLAKAEAQVSGLRTKNTRLGVASFSSSAVATLVAGVTALAGPVVGTGIPAWRAACLLAAIFGSVATISAGLIQQLKFEERVQHGTQCIGRLKALNVAVTTGRRSWDEIGADYEDLAQSYPEYVV
jgi:hypothetical protein